ncbi:hypothetical protein [Nostoc sp.]|uniref:hypothetical protein n=1 Tax=Nostoc sp. TaxID=1180 RepID=UPI002FF97878
MSPAFEPDEVLVRIYPALESSTVLAVMLMLPVLPFPLVLALTTAALLICKRGALIVIPSEAPVV